MYKDKTASLAESEKGTRLIRIDFPSEYGLTMKVKEIPGAKYYKKEDCWSMGSIKYYKELAGQFH